MWPKPGLAGVVSGGSRALGRPSQQGRSVSSPWLWLPGQLRAGTSPLYAGVWDAGALVWTRLLTGRGSWRGLLHLRTTCQSHVAALRGPACHAPSCPHSPGACGPRCHPRDARPCCVSGPPSANPQPPSSSPMVVRQPWAQGPPRPLTAPPRASLSPAVLWAGEAPLAGCRARSYIPGPWAGGRRGSLLTKEGGAVGVPHRCLILTVVNDLASDWLSRGFRQMPPAPTLRFSLCADSPDS